MKILVSAAYYTPHISGLTNSIRNVAELLAQNDYSVVVLTTQHIPSLPPQEAINDVAIHRVPFAFKISKGFVMPTFLWEAYQEIQKADQVLINLPQLEGIVVAVLGKLLGKKVHSIYVCEVTIQGGLVAKIVENILRLSNKITLSLSDSVITLTDDFASSNMLLMQSTKKITVIPPIIKQPEINNDAKKRLQKKIGDADTILIGFLGRIASEKGVEYLLDTIPQLQKSFMSNIKIILAGPSEVVGEGAYQKKISNELKKYKKNVLQIGELHDDELGAFYSLLDVLVLPSINNTEVFGMVQVEAMYSGTPVVASDLPGVRTVVQKTGMGEIAKLQNSKDLADKITRVIKHRKRYIKNQQDIHKIYSENVVLESYQQVFEKK